MNHNRKVFAAVALTVAATTVLAGCRPATPPREPFRAVDFNVNEIATQQGAGPFKTGNLVGNRDLEIVVSSLLFTPPVGGPPSPLPGDVKMYQRSGGTFTASTIIPTSAGIVGPNTPTISDVDGDGRNDVIVPAGYFFTRVSPTVGKGTLTWWKNNGDGTFTRNDVATNVNGSYHSVAHVDLDRDGVKDLVTTYEDGGFPAWPNAGPPVAPLVETQYFKGLGAGAFGPATRLSGFGGSTPVVFDVDVDGDLDIASAQYFKVKTSPNPAFGITDESFIWLENTKGNGSALVEANFTKHVIARGLGESYEIVPIDNMDGNGKYGAIGINHTNPGIAGSAAPQLVRLTPGSDPRAEWTVTVIEDEFSVDSVRPGQAAPGRPSEGDLDGDGDIDLTVHGDSDWGVYWFERKADGSWLKHDIAEEYGVPGTNYGQGSTRVADLNRDGKNEIVFTSYNTNKVVVVERVANTGGLLPAVPHQPDLLFPY